jgi:hypothetical protein
MLSLGQMMSDFFTGGAALGVKHKISIVRKSIKQSDSSNGLIIALI